MIRFVISFIALLVSSFIFIWSMYEFVGWKNQLLLVPIALGSMGIFFSCFLVFSFFQSKSFAEKNTPKSFADTPSLWWLSSLVFSLALIIGSTLIIFDRNHTSHPQQFVKIENQSSSLWVANNQTGKEIVSLGWVNNNPLNTLNENEKDTRQALSTAQTQIETPKNNITTSVSSQKQNTKTEPVQKIVTKRHYLSDGTPIPYQWERIFMKISHKE